MCGQVQVKYRKRPNLGSVSKSASCSWLSRGDHGQTGGRHHYAAYCRSMVYAGKDKNHAGCFWTAGTICLFPALSKEERTISPLPAAGSPDIYFAAFSSASHIFCIPSFWSFTFAVMVLFTRESLSFVFPLFILIIRWDGTSPFFIFTSSN